MGKMNFGQILIYSANNQSEQKVARLTALKENLENSNHMGVILTNNCNDVIETFKYRQDLTVMFVEYRPEEKDCFIEILNTVRKTNKYLPIVAYTEDQAVTVIDSNEVTSLTDFCLLYEDTVDFLAGRLMKHSNAYMSIVKSPFLKDLMDYTDECKYAWHTPGHMGGAAFRKNPPGQFFYDFLGPNVFKSDLSISVPELGSLLDHEGPIGDSEKFASEVFGSDQTYYVLNGTSSVNQIIWRGRVTKGELAFVDRNCHKSLNYAMVITEAIPTYMEPRRNGLGIIGPVRLETFTAEYMKNAVAKNPLVPAEKKNDKIKMSTLTNSTYDGLCYNVNRIKEMLTGNVDNMHFDEAWYAYAKFNPIYNEHFAMTDDLNEKEHPPIFASHSTHKLLAAFSQASMLHVKNGTTVKIDPEIFNEAYMMYGSTSPQYNMIASLDVTANMMKFNGKELLEETITDAVELRKHITKLYNEEVKKGGWFFRVWQPTTTVYEGKEIDFADAPTKFLATNQDSWVLNDKDKWHGFEGIEDDYVMLDPIKITVKMPGVNADGSFEDQGIPASIVSNYLMNFGVVAEKTDYYSFLILNSIATTKGKQGALVAGLSQFKKLYDQNAPLKEVFPDLVARFPEVYAGVGLKDHCQAMHEYIRKSNMMELMAKAFQVIPTPQYTPAEAARRVFKEEVEKVTLEQMMGRTAAVMIVPYPPGIPMMMGGEMIDEKSRAIIDYLLQRQTFEEQFPGYYGDIHGIEAVEKDGKRVFMSMVLK